MSHLTPSTNPLAPAGARHSALVPAGARPSAPCGRPAGVVRREGTTVVDGAGDRALHRGVGIGTWLLPEGYMWRLPHVDPAAGTGLQAQSPREIEALVESLVGQERAGHFWRRFREVFFTRTDVERIAAAGFDHIRLPINARVVMDEHGTFLDDGFALVDACVEWCRDAGLHVVLDLHGAPGGQTGTNIDDSPRGRPELFTDARYRALTVRLWEEIARRYAGDETVAAYDLLNEPLPGEHAARHGDALVALYRDLTAAIRAIDPEHLLMYEGTHWATDPSIFTQVWDERSVIHFHRYWSAPDIPGIAPFLEVRDRLGLPLYMGEGGENSPAWLATAFALYEDHGIGWNFWTWKKVDNPHSPAVVVPPAGWADVQAYVAGTGPRPGPEDAWATLVALLDAMPLDRCRWHPEMVAALLRRTPVELPAYAYGFHGEGVSWVSGRGAGVPSDAGDSPGEVRVDWFRADDSTTVEHHGGETGANPFAADPAERARAGEITVRMRAGDQVSYDVTLGEATRSRGLVDVTLVAVLDREIDGAGVAGTDSSATDAGAVAGGAGDIGAAEVRVTVDGTDVDGVWSGSTWHGQTSALPPGTATTARQQSRVTVGVVAGSLVLRTVTVH